MTDWSPFDHHAMQRALDQAALGLYTTGENPRVGSVIARDGEILAEAYHRAPGEPHAEVLAMQGVNPSQLRGATCYVTLEPCAHQGKTGPCADTLIAAGVHRVVAAMEDPNPLVSGQGFARLVAAGIVVEVGLLAADAEALNPGFIQRMRTQRPWVWLKSAASLDGKTAMADGESKWITGTAARQDVQRLRARCGAVVTGIETVLYDDPRLTVRHAEAGIDWPCDLPVRQPVRVILDSKGRLPKQGALFDSEGPILWVTTIAVDHPQLQTGRITHWQAPADAAGRIHLQAVMTHLASMGVNEVLVEAGSTLSGACITDGLVDRGVLYLAAKLLGPSGRSLYDVAPVQLADAPRLLISDCRLIGDDLRVEWTLRTQ